MVLNNLERHLLNYLLNELSAISSNMSCNLLEEYEYEGTEEEIKEFKIDFWTWMGENCNVEDRPMMGDFVAKFMAEKIIS